MLSLLRKITPFYLWLLLFLLPLKFGSSVVIGEIGVFPLHWLEWLLAPWPPFLLAPLCGLGLLLALCLVGESSCLINRSGVLSALAWMAVLLCALPGLFGASNFDFATRFLWHLLGTVSLALAFLLVLSKSPGWRDAFLLAVALAGLITVFHGWQQVPGGGLESTLEYAEERAELGNYEISEDMRSRLERNRAFGPFVYPNSYAAHLLLVGPLLLIFWRRWGMAAADWMREEPTLSRLVGGIASLPHWGGMVMVFAGLILWGGALWFCGSRGSAAALIGAGIVWLFIGSLKHRLTVRLLAMLLLAAVLLGSGFFHMVRQQGQEWSDVDARFGYWQAATEMILDKPLTGVGLGDFFPYYMRFKTAEMEVTRLPHNGFLFFASQAGLAAGAAFCLLGLPWLALLWKADSKCTARLNSDYRDEQWLKWLVGFGGLAWFIHSWADFNIVIPGTVATAAVLPILLFAACGPAEKATGSQDDDSAADITEKRKGLLISRRTRIWLALFAVIAVVGIWRWPGEKAYVQLSMKHVDISTLPYFQEEVEKTARRMPFSPHPWQLLGKRAEQLQVPTVAAAGYRQAAARSPRWAAIWFRLARSELTLSNRKAAERAYHKGLQWYPESPDIEDLRREFGE